MKAHLNLTHCSLLILKSNILVHVRNTSLINAFWGNTCVLRCSIFDSNIRPELINGGIVSAPHTKSLTSH